MPNEDLQGDWNAVSFANGELGRCTAVRERRLSGRSRTNGYSIFARHRNQRRAERISGSRGLKNVLVFLFLDCQSKAFGPTCTAMSLLHPDITIRLGYTSLRVQERH